MLNLEIFVKFKYEFVYKKYGVVDVNLIRITENYFCSASKIVI